MPNKPTKRSPDYLREFEKNRIAKGICVKCNNPIKAGNSRFCEDHQLKNCKRAAMHREKRKSLNLCCQCGKEPAKSGTSCVKCRKTLNSYHTKYRELVLNHYGNQCNCCGITQKVFLTIDHIDGSGAEHRKKGRSRVYRSIIKENYPDNYQVLCWNCNSAKHLMGTCPHQI